MHLLAPPRSSDCLRPPSPKAHVQRPVMTRKYAPPQSLKSSVSRMHGLVSANHCLSLSSNLVCDQQCMHTRNMSVAEYLLPSTDLLLFSRITFLSMCTPTANYAPKTNFGRKDPSNLNVVMCILTLKGPSFLHFPTPLQSRLLSMFLCPPAGPCCYNGDLQKRRQ